MEEIMELLRDINDEIDYGAEKHLVTGGHLTSLDLLTFIAEAEEKFNIEFSATEITPANFESVETIWNLILSKKG